MGGVFKLTVIIKKAAEEILNSMLNNLPSDYDKTEGGLFYDNLAPISIEFSNFRYIKWDLLIHQKEFFLKRLQQQ